MSLLLLFSQLSGGGSVTQTVTLQAQAGLTAHSIRLKTPLGVLIDTQSALELSAGVYGADFTDAAAGFAFVQFVRDSDSAIIAHSNVTLTADTAAFPCDGSGAVAVLDSAAILAVADQVWDEATSDHTTAGTYGGRIVRATNSNTEVQITGSNHIAADIHNLQSGVITAGDFAANSITASALATDAVTEIQSGLATSAALVTLRGADNDTLKTLSDQIDTVSADVSSIASVSREAF